MFGDIYFRIGVGFDFLFCGVYVFYGILYGYSIDFFFSYWNFLVCYFIVLLIGSIFFFSSKYSCFCGVKFGIFFYFWSVDYKDKNCCYCICGVFEVVCNYYIIVVLFINCNFIGGGFIWLLYSCLFFFYRDGGGII